MKMTFEQSNVVPDGAEAIFRESSIQERYFEGNSTLSRSLQQAAELGELFLGKNEEGRVVAIMRSTDKGFCSIYPYIKLLGVDPDFRGKGVGSFMFDQIEERARQKGSRRITLMVSDFNERAEKAYVKRGYRRLCAIPDCVKMGIEEHLMIKDL